MLDEACVVARGTTLDSKPRLKSCERADRASPGLRRNNGDGHEVRGPKPDCIDPVPPIDVANHDHDQPADYKQDDGSMQNEDQISERLVHGDPRL